MYTYGGEKNSFINGVSSNKFFTFYSLTYFVSISFVELRNISYGDASSRYFPTWVNAKHIDFSGPIRKQQNKTVNY